MAWILIILLILLGGLIAPFGDLLGTKIGKSRFSIFRLRPKKTATFITVITGGLISSISIGLLSLFSADIRQRLSVDIPVLQKTLEDSKKALIPLKAEREKLEDKILQKESELNQLKNNINEFRRGNVVLKRGQTLFIAEINSNPNRKLDLAKLFDTADKYVRRIVIPSKNKKDNILLWKSSDISEIERVTRKEGNWILVLKSATNVLKGENYVFVAPRLFKNKLIVRKGEVITKAFWEKSDRNFKALNSKINTLMSQTRNEIKLKGSIANEITTRGDFMKQLRDALKSNPKYKFKLEVVSLRDSKIAEPIVVELNIKELEP